MDHILIIEDEQAIADTLLYALETEGFATEWVRLGREGVARVLAGGVDLVVLDIGLPDGSGFEFCKAIRRHADTPVLILTARDAEIDRIVGLEIGADDYVTKPFSPREVAARVRAILRRARPTAAALPQPAASPSAEHWPGLELDPTRAEVRFNGIALELTRTEYLILKTLIGSPGQVFTRGQLMQHVWDEPHASLERAVDTHIKGIRSKLKAISPDQEPIRTHRGIGYSLEGPAREL